MTATQSKVIAWAPRVRRVSRRRRYASVIARDRSLPGMALGGGRGLVGRRRRGLLGREDVVDELQRLGVAISCGDMPMRFHRTSSGRLSCLSLTAASTAWASLRNSGLRQMTSASVIFARSVSPMARKPSRMASSCASPTGRSFLRVFATSPDSAAMSASPEALTISPRT
jgi:hypothetical protein